MHHPIGQYPTNWAVNALSEKVRAGTNISGNLTDRAVTVFHQPKSMRQRDGAPVFYGRSVQHLADWTVSPDEAAGVPTLHVGLRGMHLLDTPIFNKGTAFTDEERSVFGLHGLLPPYIESLEEQTSRAYEAYRRKTDDLERHIYLRALQDTNKILFYKLLNAHIEEMMPIVYTPVVALGCQQFSSIYRRSRGLFISYPLRDSIPSLLRNRPSPDVDVIVVKTASESWESAIKAWEAWGYPSESFLYSLIGGIHPARTLPVMLDVGTNNKD